MMGALVRQSQQQLKSGLLVLRSLSAGGAFSSEGVPAVRGMAIAASAGDGGGGEPVDAGSVKKATRGPAAKKWWRPDPATGTWVPEGYEGQMTTSTDVMKSASRVTRFRNESTASLEDKRWWTSMEELPDMDRADPK